MTADAVRTLAEDFWNWRSGTSFWTSDDIPRIDHEPGWMPDFSRTSVDDRRSRATEFLDRWRALDARDAPVPVQVDHRLLGSAMQRVVWEVDELRNWEKNAVFLVGQILGPWFDLLVQPPPFSPRRQAGLVAVCGAIPGRLDLAWSHLEEHGVAALARVAVELLTGIDDRFATSARELAPFIESDVALELDRLATTASHALESFRRKLQLQIPHLAPSTPVGREKFIWFLRNVALLPDEPEELVRAAQQDYRRAVMSELVASHRRRADDRSIAFSTAAEQVIHQAMQEQQVRDFLENEGLLTQPDSLGQYHIAPMPPYLAPLTWLAVTNDLTSEQRLDQDGVSYCPHPSESLPYFYVANAMDPRLGIVHEGAHYKQLALSWANPNPVRRHYYDSVANEGIAFYNEELMLLAGLFDDHPASEPVIHNFNRLRSLRVVADVNLATGEFSLEQAIDHFVNLVPMDRETAVGESAMYLATPGLAMSYHVGKMQLVRLLTDATLAQGQDFSLRGFHDYVWRNGNVPYSLQRWELLGDRSDVDLLDAATG